MKTLTLLTAFILLLLGSCKKEPLAPQLPPYTQEGKNIFACKINGEVFIAKGVMDKNTLNPKGIDNNYMVWGNDTLVRLTVKENEPKEGEFNIYFIYTLTKDTFELNGKQNSVAIVHLPVENHTFAKSRYTTNADHKGFVLVKYFQNKIIAGTFEFTAIDDRGEVIHVTDGRFDISTK